MKLREHDEITRTEEEIINFFVTKKLIPQNRILVYKNVNFIKLYTFMKNKKSYLPKFIILPNLLVQNN